MYGTICSIFLGNRLTIAWGGGWTSEKRFPQACYFDRIYVLAKINCFDSDSIPRFPSHHPSTLDNCAYLVPVRPGEYPSRIRWVSQNLGRSLIVIQLSQYFPSLLRNWLEETTETWRRLTRAVPLFFFWTGENIKIRSMIKGVTWVTIIFIRTGIFLFEGWQHSFYNFSRLSYFRLNTILTFCCSIFWICCYSKSTVLSNVFWW